MSQLFDLTGKVALMTGASKGIGRAMAEGLAEHGAKVMVSSRKMDQCEQAATSINQTVGADLAVPFACNAGRKNELEALVEATHSQLGPVDIMIGNAGVNPYYGPLADIPDEAYDKIMTTNVKSNLWLAKLVVSDMVKKGSGSIMITSSTGAFAPSSVLGAYGISKLAVIALIRNLAEEYGPSGIRANAICPGLIKTDFARVLWETPEAEANANENTPLRRLGEANDLKGLAVFLASDASSYITGQAHTVCGGSHMWS